MPVRMAALVLGGDAKVAHRSAPRDVGSTFPIRASVGDARQISPAPRIRRSKKPNDQKSSLTTSCASAWARGRIRDASERRAVDVVVGHVEVHGVEQVENVGAHRGRPASTHAPVSRCDRSSDELRRTVEGQDVEVADLARHRIEEDLTRRSVGVLVSVSGPTARPRVRIDHLRIDPVDDRR